ncbi:hypothetical protein LV779_27030 [Streptomyces thinghirensis]|nr:hypothetical protein [Streptomyces thinghirensis]
MQVDIDIDTVTVEISGTRVVEDVSLRAGQWPGRGTRRAQRQR